MDETEPPIPSISPAGLKTRLDQGSPLAVLDVREPRERRHAAIPVGPGVLDLFVPLGEVEASVAEILASLEGRPLVVYCHHGIRSMAAATWLKSQGVPDIANLDGGIDAWSRRVNPGVRRY